MSHHLPCKAGTVTELADLTAISGVVVIPSKAGFTLSQKCRLEKLPQEGPYRADGTFGWLKATSNALSSSSVSL